MWNEQTCPMFKMAARWLDAAVELNILTVTLAMLTITLTTEWHDDCSTEDIFDKSARHPVYC